MGNKIDSKKLRHLVKQELIKEAEEMKKRKAIHAIIVDITKAGSDGMKAMKAIKSKQMPTGKARAAVEASIDALRAIFADMLRNPTKYLDKNPNDVVDSRISDLDKREEDQKLIDGSEKDITL